MNGHPKQQQSQEAKKVLLTFAALTNIFGAIRRSEG